ncbi:MAG: envelope stress response membrane protein PspB [Gammaproteobacteria bacterium]|nr:envelope stress response membrane protein PspB [Gammaproteobacteria bacterium]
MKDLTNLLMTFLILIAPLWLILHYRSRSKAAALGMKKEDLQKLDELRDTARALQERIQALEKILDAKAPDWRRRQ